MFGHPKGLFVLFFTELWERFSFYGMRAILVLYCVAQTNNGGLGWTNDRALSLYGSYCMLAYLGTMLGGHIADRWLSARKSVMLGGALLCFGHLLMAVQHLYVFYIALGLIILGVNFLKPNISTMVGGLYHQGDARRDAGFTLFYMGINIGALLATLLVGGIGEKIGWHYGFTLAGFGMIVGQCVYIWGQKYLGESGLLVAGKQNADGKAKSTLTVSEKIRILFALVAYIVFSYVLLTHALSTKALLVFLIPVAIWWLWGKQKQTQKVASPPLSGIEKRRLIVVFISFVLVIIFFSAFEQAGGFMTIYANDFTRRTLLGWEIPASWFQSLNPFFVITLGGVLAALWVWLGKKKKDPSDFFKMGLGTAIMGFGFVVMLGASIVRSTDALGQSSMSWLVFAYLLHTLGELFLSPVALSYITKMSPKHLVSTIMGIYFATTGLGEKAAGEIGRFASEFGDKEMFLWVSVVTVGMGFLFMLGTRFVKKFAHEEEIHD